MSDHTDAIVRVVQVLAVFIVLAICSPPMSGCTKEKAYIAAMKSDLRNLMSAQEQHRAEQGSYAASLSDVDFSTSSGVTISIGEVSRAGWNAWAIHGGTRAWCGVFVGNARLYAKVAEAGVPACWS